jgi:hypothetical protein
MSVQFASCLYDTMADACDECIASWLYADGLNNTEYVRGVLDSMTDRQIIDEMLIDWKGPTGSDRDDLIEAVARLREHIMEITS